MSPSSPTPCCASPTPGYAPKHHGYFMVDEHCDVIDGVAGIDSRFSAFRPPPTPDFVAIDARMLVRALADTRPHADAFAGAWTHWVGEPQRAREAA